MYRGVTKWLKYIGKIQFLDLDIDQLRNSAASGIERLDKSFLVRSLADRSQGLHLRVGQRLPDLLFAFDGSNVRSRILQDVAIKGQPLEKAAYIHPLIFERGVR